MHTERQDMEPDRAKRRDGRYYTETNPFVWAGFKKWARKHDIKNDVILEPFAGRNDLITMLAETGLCKWFMSYDIKPADRQVARRDTIARFPQEYRTCVSNPPWLGRYAAKRRGLDWPDIEYDDLYKHCLDLALQNCENVGFIIPATFLHWWGGLSRQSSNKGSMDRLESVTFLNNRVFSDTENPVCMALFGSKRSKDVSIYYDNDCVGKYSQLKRHLPTTKPDMSIRFNDKDGALGLVCIDNTIGPTIRFCRGREINSIVQESSRSLTRIDHKGTRDVIDELNHRFNRFRNKTYDVFLTPFKGLRRDGRYRRRLDYQLAREMICQYAS